MIGSGFSHYFAVLNIEFQIFPFDDNNSPKKSSEITVIKSIYLYKPICKPICPTQIDQVFQCIQTPDIYPALLKDGLHCLSHYCGWEDVGRDVVGGRGTFRRRKNVVNHLLENYCHQMEPEIFEIQHSITQQSNG